MTCVPKRGALLFFGKAKCVECHRVDGEANEMFSDFEEHVVGVPQNAPMFGAASATSSSTVPAETRTSAARADAATRRIATSSARRRCATWPCRSAFFHNGAYTPSRRSHPVSPERRRIGAALQPGARRPPERSHAPDRPADSKPLIDPRLRNPIELADQEFPRPAALRRAGPAGSTGQAVASVRLDSRVGAGAGCPRWCSRNARLLSRSADAESR